MEEGERERVTGNKVKKGKKDVFDVVDGCFVG